MNNLSSVFAIDTFLPLAKIITVVVLCTVVLSCAFCMCFDKTNGRKKAKYIFLAFVVYCLVIGVCCLVLDIIKHYSNEYLLENQLNKDYLLKYVLYPVCVFLTGILLSVIAVLIANKHNSARKKLVGIIAVALDVAIFIFTIIMLAVYYNAKIKNDGYYNSDSYGVNQPVLYFGSAVFVLGIIATVFAVDKDKTPFSTRNLAFAGVCIATSFCLSYIKIFRMPQGGSITLASLLPLCIFSFKFGIKKGVLVCFAYGVLQAVQDPFIIHPAQFLLDYPIAFTCVGLSGIFKTLGKFNKTPQIQLFFGGLLSGILRFVCHTLSGVFAFSAYAEGANPLAYSLIYNSYVIIDIAVVIVLGTVLFSSKALYKELILK